MKEISFECVSKKSKEQIWGLYENPQVNWGKWDKSLKSVDYNLTNLKNGNELVLNLLNGKKIKTLISDVDINKGFTNLVKNALVSIEFKHLIKECDDKVIVLHSAVVNVKVLKFLEKKICDEIYKDLKEAVINLAKSEMI